MIRNRVLLLSPPHHYPGKNQNDNDDDGGDGHPIELHRGTFSCCEMETTAGLYNALHSNASETLKQIVPWFEISATAQRSLRLGGECFQTLSPQRRRER
jgi:hypothetical protein